jgi:hypothetical protein
MFLSQQGRLEEVHQRLSTDTFKVVVWKMPIEDVPYIGCGIPETALGSSDGVSFRVAAMPGAVEEIWGPIAPADFKVLCEECAMEGVEKYEALLRDTPARELDKKFNEHHTFRSIYQMKLQWAQETLWWVQGTDSNVLKQKIQYL